jgi:hypothetical protein
MIAVIALSILSILYYVAKPHLSKTGASAKSAPVAPTGQPVRIPVPDELKPKPEPAAPPAAQQQEEATPKTTKEKEKEVVLVKGLLKEYLEPSNDFSSFAPSIGQKVVSGVSFGQHPLQIGHLMQRVHGYIKVAQPGTYVIQVTQAGKRIAYVEVVVAGEVKTINRFIPSSVRDDNVKSLNFSLNEGVHELHVSMGYVGDEKDNRPAGISVLAAPKGMLFKDVSNQSYPDYYQIYFDKSKLAAATEKKFIFAEDEQKEKKK